MLINNETIIKDTNPLIREKSEPVSLPLSKEDEQLLRDLFQYVKDSTDEEKAKDLNPAPGSRHQCNSGRCQETADSSHCG